MQTVKEIKLSTRALDYLRNSVSIKINEKTTRFFMYDLQTMDEEELQKLQEDSEYQLSKQRMDAILANESLKHVIFEDCYITEHGVKAIIQILEQKNLESFKIGAKYLDHSVEDCLVASKMLAEIAVKFFKTQISFYGEIVGGGTYYEESKQNLMEGMKASRCLRNTLTKVKLLWLASQYDEGSLLNEIPDDCVKEISNSAFLVSLKV